MRVRKHTSTAYTPVPRTRLSPTAAFVMCRYVTGAVDRVSRYPALLDEVGRSAKLDKAELAVLVRDRLRHIRSLDGFMRVTGVVKERQLDDLNEDCWSHVRRYLATDDVKCGAVNNG
ncbi:hypothetical protein HPB52_014398 [Rhipicephalus sanguineus]|uniref:Uncharacterized protein n=1 Tax=Rhipicephalus sanguineus TaxID=34632 RepID=A0A9D4T5Q4_RHISA|nr:hypothetical protein HPB52_014398 [Rhipicephalus sanguineus]